MTTTSIDIVIARLTTDVVTSYLSRHDVAPTEVPNFIRQVNAALRESGGMTSALPQNEIESAIAEGAAPTKEEVAETRGLRSVEDGPAIPIEKSVTRDYIYCLEDGRPLKMLKRYLRAQYGLTPSSYRAKWGLPEDYPMTAPGYSEEKRAHAKKVGLGTDKYGRPKTRA